MLKTVGRLVLALAVAVTLTACGGGGGSTPPAPLPTSSVPEGMWSGATSSNRFFTGFVLDNGVFWFLYSVQGNINFIAGAVQGTGTSLNGNFTSTNAKDFNLEGLGILDAIISGSYVLKDALNGNVNYSTLNQNISFVSRYDTNYDLTPSLTTLAGTYTGNAAVVAGTEAATLTISTTGAITGSGASGCQFTGTAVPRQTGNVYDVSVTFGGGVCSNGSDTVTGIGYFDAASKRLWATALNSTRSNGFIFAGFNQSSAVGPFQLTFSLDATFQVPHGNQPIRMAAVRLSDGFVVAETSGTVSATQNPSFTFAAGAVMQRGTSYAIHYWIDSNINGGTLGICDPKAIDHQWSVEFLSPTNDVNFTVSYNPALTEDVCATFP